MSASVLFGAVSILLVDQSLPSDRPLVTGDLVTRPMVMWSADDMSAPLLCRRVEQAAPPGLCVAALTRLGLAVICDIAESAL